MSRPATRAATRRTRANHASDDDDGSAPTPIAAAASSKKKNQPAKKKAKRGQTEEAIAMEVEETAAPTPAGASASASARAVSAGASVHSPPVPFDPYLPRDLLRIIFQYSPPGDLATCVDACPWIASDRLLCRSAMRYYSSQPPIPVSISTGSYHEQTLAGSICNNYPFYLARVHRESPEWKDVSLEISATEHICGPDDDSGEFQADVSPEFIQVLKEGGMWDDQVNAIFSPEASAALRTFVDTPEYQTYARLSPYNSMFRRVDLPLVDLYQGHQLTSTGQPAIFHRPMHALELALWRKWTGPMEKLDVHTTATTPEDTPESTPAAASSSTISVASSLPAAASSSSASPSSVAPSNAVPVFLSQAQFLSAFDAMFAHQLWHHTIRWQRWLCVGGSVLRAILNPAYHDFARFAGDPAASLSAGAQDVDFFWTSSDFYKFQSVYKAWKRTMAQWLGKSNVHVVSETDYVQVVAVTFPVGTEPFAAQEEKEDDDDEDEDDEDDEEEEEEEEGPKKKAKNAKKSSHATCASAAGAESGAAMSDVVVASGRTIHFNFIWYDDHLSASSILNIFDLDVCQVAFTGRTCVATPACVESLRTRSLVNYKLINSPKDVRYIAPRSRKYQARGFQLFVPHAFRDEVLTDAWAEALHLTERAKKRMGRAERSRQAKEAENKKKRADKRAAEAAAAAKKSRSCRSRATRPATPSSASSEEEDAAASSFSPSRLTPADMNTLKLDRGEGRRGHFPGVTFDEEDGDHDGESTGDWDGQTHYSGFLLNNDSMRVRQAFLTKCIQANHQQEW